MMHTAAKLEITGRVQGVWFRGATQQEARRLGLAGWVRNMPDGSVSALVQGPKDKVRLLINWAEKGGPPSAYVDAVSVTWIDPDQSIDGFLIRR